MPTLEEQKEISSAEMTAIYRSAIPELSSDNISEKLASITGKEKALGFIKNYNYPLVNRKISLRAGYCLWEATRLISSGNYDSCISLASGFSLLLYLIASMNSKHAHISYFDTDLPYIIKVRNKRIREIQHEFKEKILARIQSKVFDLEEAYKQNRDIKEVFPNCHHPIFIIEGVIYFLSQGCVDWLITQIGSYSRAAIIMDYWPDDMQQKSSLFARVYKDINKIIPEQTKSFWDDATMEKFKGLFPYISDLTIADVDKAFSSTQKPPLEPELVDPNQYFPLKMITAEKRGTSGNFLHAKL